MDSLGGRKDICRSARISLFVTQCVDIAARFIASKGHFAREHLVENHAHRVDI
jgi:hypothetical protein